MTVRKFFGWLFAIVGGVVMVLAGMCTIGFEFAFLGHGGNDAILPLLIGGIPTVVAFGLFMLGRRMLSDRADAPPRRLLKTITETLGETETDTDAPPRASRPWREYLTSPAGEVGQTLDYLARQIAGGKSQDTVWNIGLILIGLGGAGGLWAIVMLFDALAPVSIFGRMDIGRVLAVILASYFVLLVGLHVIRLNKPPPDDGAGH